MQGDVLTKFSVVIPLYNKEPHIKRALDSVLSQTIQDFEIIVVNDGSTDQSAQVVENLKNSKIRLISQDNTGVSVARNRGIDESKSELIAFLDADDEWMPDFLETILQLQKNYPFAGIYATSLKNEFMDNVLLELNDELIRLVPEEGLLTNYFKVYKTGHALFCSSSVAVPAKVFSEIGGFQAGFWWGEDVDMWGRIALKYPIAYSSQACSVYYQNVTNSAVERRCPVRTHPFIETAKRALKLGEVPPEIINDLEEYIKFLEMFTAKHNIKAGDKNLAIKLLARNDIKLAYKKKLLRIILSTNIKNNYPMISKVILKYKS